MPAISDEIHQLAKSITAREAGYISAWLIQSKIPLAKPYKKLLDLLRKQEEYNERAVLKQLRNKQLQKNFSYHKTVLSGYITDALVAYNSAASTEYKIHHLLEASSVLYHRSLYQQSMKMLDKARREAQHYQKLYLLLQICEHERKLLKRLTPKDLKEALDANAAEKKAIWKQIETEEQYTNFNDQAFSRYVELNRIKADNVPPDLSAMMQHPLLQTLQTPKTFDSKLKYHHIHALYAQLTGNFALALEHRETMKELWNNNPHMISEMPVRYRSDLSGLLSMRHENAKYQGFEELIASIENVKAAGSIQNDAGIFREVYYLRQLYLLNTDKWQQALELIPQIEQGLLLHEKSIGQSRVYSFWYNIAVTYFITGHYKACQPWVEKLNDISRKSTVRTDLRDFAGILLVILHYETGRNELVEYQLYNAKRRLRKTNKLYEFETIVLQFLGKFLQAQNNQEKIKKLRQQLVVQLQQLSQRQGKQSLLGLDEVLIWACQKAA